MNTRLVTADASINPASSSRPSVLPALDYPGVSAPGIQEWRLRKVLQLIASEPCRSVRELATEVSLSPSHLQRLFKQESGGRVGQLVTESRLQTAARMLGGSAMPIKEIAYAVGYEHSSSFVRAFQRKFGQAPRRYRKQHCMA
jgi:AraC family transcriptional regulator